MSNANKTKTQLPKLTNLRDVLKAAHKNKILYDYEDDYDEESRRSSQLSLIDNILKLADSDLTAKLDNNNNNKKNINYNKKILQPAITPHLNNNNNKNFDRKNISRETEAEQIKIINSQLMKDKKAISSREDTKKINSIQLNNHTEITTSERKNDNSLNSLVFKNNKATNEEEEETESSISSSCSSDSSICTTTNNTEEIINKNFNNIKQDQSFIDYSSIMRQSVDIESYNSKLPLSSSSSSSSYWNYDELNDLRIKFISLLSSDLTSEKSGNQEELAQFNTQSAVYNFKFLSNSYGSGICTNLFVS
jgi:hypothetical protein